MLAKLMITLVRGYQIMLSPYLGSNCRFAPTCSQYTIEALREHGVLKGSALAINRIRRCHPWNAGGNDPVPKKHCNDFDNSSVDREK